MSCDVCMHVHMHMRVKCAYYVTYTWVFLVHAV